jgi:hypothetical protein
MKMQRHCIYTLKVMRNDTLLAKHEETSPLTSLLTNTAIDEIFSPSQIKLKIHLIKKHPIKNPLEEIPPRKCPVNPL